MANFVRRYHLDSVLDFFICVYCEIVNRTVLFTAVNAVCIVQKLLDCELLILCFLSGLLCDIEHGIFIVKKIFRYVKFGFAFRIIIIVLYIVARNSHIGDNRVCGIYGKKLIAFEICGDRVRNISCLIIQNKVYLACKVRLNSNVNILAARLFIDLDILLVKFKGL